MTEIAIAGLAVALLATSVALIVVSWRRQDWRLSALAAVAGFTASGLAWTVR